jgi:hypothetical protein
MRNYDNVVENSQPTAVAMLDGDAAGRVNDLGGILVSQDVLTSCPYQPFAYNSSTKAKARRQNSILYMSFVWATI